MTGEDADPAAAELRTLLAVEEQAADVAREAGHALAEAEEELDEHPAPGRTRRVEALRAALAEAERVLDEVRAARRRVEAGMSPREVALIHARRGPPG